MQENIFETFFSYSSVINNARLNRERKKKREGERGREGRVRRESKIEGEEESL